MAQVRAFVRARLALGLTLGELVANALRRRDGVPGIEDRLLLLLVDRITLELGIDRTAQVEVAASAALSARLQLRDTTQDRAGFDLRLSGGAAFLYGKELGFFLRRRSPSVEGYQLDATTLVTYELAYRSDRPGQRLSVSAPLVFAQAVAAGLSGNPSDRMSGAFDGMVPPLRQVIEDALEDASDAIEDALERAEEIVAQMVDALAAVEAQLAKTFADIDAGIEVLRAAAIAYANAPIDLRLFVNGAEIAVTTLRRRGSRLSGRLPPAIIRRGRNDVDPAVAVPTR